MTRSTALSLLLALPALRASGSSTGTVRSQVPDGMMQQVGNGFNTTTPTTAGNPLSNILASALTRINFREPPPLKVPGGGGGGAAGSVAGAGGGAIAGGAIGAQAPSLAGFGLSAAALTIKAGAQLQLGDNAAACASAQAALKLNPGDAKAAKIAAEACRAELMTGPQTTGGDGIQIGIRGAGVDVMGGKTAMLQTSEKGGAILGVNADSPALQSWFVRITEAKGRGDDSRVILFCDEAAHEFPGDVNLLNAKATAQNRLKDFKGALETANQALAADPKNAVAYVNKAFALGGLGDREGMIAALRAAAALDPRFEEALKAALAGDAAGLFAGLSGGASPRKPIPMFVWILVPALAGFALMLIFVALARRSFPPAPIATEVVASRAATIEEGMLLAGSYRVDSELGRGGMGVVFGAFDEKLQRRVAIKQLQTGPGTTPEDLARFLREARLVAKLKHANLAEIYNVLEEKGEHLLVFEFIDGRTLDKLIWANRKMPAAQAEKIVGEIAAALDCAHAQKIIHRDLKPSNVMLAKDGTVKVMDFGIAHQASGASDSTRTMASGTPPYMAPEQGLGSVSTSSDLYALGVIAYEMIVGVKPFDGPDFLEQKLRKAYTPASQRDPALGVAYDAFFAAALDPDPTKRHATGAEFAAAFQRARA